ncbi:hypothetical protein ACQKO5_14655 [Novosphingobium subterraneum]|uniref:hypothetical protein n=1 Tax=Novosphingobium subterraneum TaxID=48936 RepID=UPI003D0344DD
MSLADQFQQALLEDSREYTERTGTNPSRFLQMLSQHAAVETARLLALSPDFPEGFTRAWEHKCLELTVEYLMIYGENGRYLPLFDDHVLKAAKRRLKSVGVTKPKD